LNTVQVLVFYMSFYTHVWLLENNVNTVALFSFSTWYIPHSVHKLFYLPVIYVYIICFTKF